ncbi:MAG TPA: hypothetical protein VGB24_23645 [Longimicrobium sp.]|jgi:hypothetical protein|uniref:hypothetical protein n=1 Tax=Longimicrobium sp. TaxID=2029185 RepID=UPI002ED84798
MKLSDVRTAYEVNSGKASDIARQLGFAGIALIWLFRTEVAGQPQIPDALLTPGLMIVIALTFDLLQYVSGAIVWSVYNRRAERLGRSQDEEFDVPPAINWPALFFFWAKVAFLALAYVHLGLFVAGSIV